MTYRIKVEKPDHAGDVLVKLQHRRKWLWNTLDYTWVLKSSQMAEILEKAKRNLRLVAKQHANPQVSAHVEVLDV